MIRSPGETVRAAHESHLDKHTHHLHCVRLDQCNAHAALERMTRAFSLAVTDISGYATNYYMLVATSNL